MKTRTRLFSLLALTAALAGCWGSPTGTDETPKEDTDDGSGKAPITALVAASTAATG